MHPNIWKPFTILKDAPEPLKVIRGNGLWVTLEDGRRIMDCISSWWVNLHGHCHPYIVNAIHEQARELEHIIFANFSHQPAERFAERLAARLPGQLNRIFYSDNGSTSIEVALKVACQYWHNTGRSRKRFIAFEGAYHGDTLGAMSAGSRSVFTRVYDDFMFEVDYLSYPETWIGDKTVEDRENDILDQLEKKLKGDPGSVAGIIIEPLVQGVAGMRMCREEFLQKLHRICRQYETLLIFDEVMTGFGRTGAWFAAERSGTEPDIICLAKGITGGFLPLAVTVCSDRIYEAFNTSDPVGTLWHGHSYTANPLGCAAALASLDLMEKNEPAFTGMEKIHLEELSKIAEMDFVERARVKGSIAAFNLQSEDESGYLNDIGNRIKESCVDFGLLIRPLGNVVYLMPPYCITRRELGTAYRQLGALLQDIYSDQETG
ncbi:MAG: adenosylmethionine--8-amino-7-oxononanoate transaminase [Balneolaceae bacterium]